MTEEQEPYAARPPRRMSIKGLIPSLPERGKIKIGMLGQRRTSRQGNEYQQPIRLGHFLVTTMERGEDGNLIVDKEIHRLLGSDTPTAIPVRLLYDDVDLNCMTRYAAYQKKVLWCSGDGEFANRLQPNGEHASIRCPCPLADPGYSPHQPNDPPKCKMNGSLSVIIEGAGLGGVWKFRTTGYNSITALLGTMQFYATITGGPLANIPFLLKVKPKRGVNPVDGTPVDIHYVTLEYDGDDASLRRIGHQIALDRATTHISILEIETEARRRLQLAAPLSMPLPGDESEDIVQEFYPEQYDAGPDDAAPPPPTRADIKARRDAPAIESDAREAELPAHVVTPPAANRQEPDAAGGGEEGQNEDGQVVDNEGELRPYRSLAVAEQMLIGVLNEALKRTLAHKPGTLGFKAFEVAVDNNAHLLGGRDEPMENLPLSFREIAARMNERIADARAQIEKAKEPRPARPVVSLRQPAFPTKPRASDKSGNLLDQQTPATLPASLGATHQDRVLSQSGEEMVESKPTGPETSQTAEPTGANPIRCEKIPFSETGNVDWRETARRALDDVARISTKAQFDGFRSANTKFLAEMRLYCPDGLKSLNEALAKKDSEFYP
jgi:hypothetical protein